MATKRTTKKKTSSAGLTADAVVVDELDAFVDAAPCVIPSKVRAVGKYERLALERHDRDLRTGHLRGLVWRPEMGDRVIDFVERFCRHHKGEWAGKPLLLEEWQKHLLRIVFGWYRANGTRRFRISYWELARKNGKSELAAAVGLYLMLADGEPGAEVYSAATTLEQARIVWDTAWEMTKVSPALSRHIMTNTAPPKMTVARNASKWRPLSSEGKKLDGLNVHGAVIDELHAHENHSVWNVLLSARGARRQPMTFTITTAGEFDETSVGWEQHEYAQKILDGEIEDDSFFAIIYAADAEDDFFSDAAMEKANPNIDISVKRDDLHEQAAAARVKMGERNEYLTKRLCVWTTAKTTWLNLDKWKACEPKKIDRDEFESALEGMECVAGLDLSSKKDLTAFAMRFDTPDGVFLIVRYWLPEERVRELEKKGLRHYRLWADAGWISLTPGSVVDYAAVQKKINEDAARFRIREIGFDPWNATDLVNRLTETDGHTCVEVRQGVASLSEPSKLLEADVLELRVRHGNNPVLTWNASNCAVLTDANGNIRPSKPEDKSSKRIDGIAAVIIAGSRAVKNPESGDAYAERGFISLDDGIDATPPAEKPAGFAPRDSWLDEEPDDN